jgi:hypothetical protein
MGGTAGWPGATLGPWSSQEAAVSHAALVNVGLLYIVVVQPILLVVFVRAVSRAPSGPPDSPGHPAPGPLPPQVSAPRTPEPARIAARAPWPPADAVEQPGETGYVGRHVTRGGPPWGPAPKPPGAAW